MNKNKILPKKDLLQYWKSLADLNDDEYNICDTDSIEHFPNLPDDDKDNSALKEYNVPQTTKSKDVNQEGLKDVVEDLFLYLHSSLSNKGARKWKK